MKQAQNYTPEQTERLRTLYMQAPTDVTAQSLADELGKTKRSVIAKLTHEGVYVPKTKAKAEVMTLKADLVTEITDLVGIEGVSLESLEKATREALTAVRDALLEV